MEPILGIIILGGLGTTIFSSIGLLIQSVNNYDNLK